MCLFMERTFKFRIVSEQEFEVLDLGEVTARGGGKNIAMGWLETLNKV